MNTPTQTEIQTKKTTGNKLCLWEVAPHICIQLKDKEDGFKYTAGSGLLIPFIDGSLKRICSAFHNSRPKSTQSRTPRNVLKTIEGRAKQIQIIESKIGIKTPSDWYDQNVDQSFDICPGLKRYGRSIDVLIEAYKIIDPTFEWKIYKFNTSPFGFWDSIYNCINWFKDLEQHYKCYCLKDWINFAKTNELSNNIRNFYGSTILGGVRTNKDSIRFDGNSYQLIQFFCLKLYNQTCKPWEWPRMPQGEWNKDTVQIDFIKWIEEKENIVCIDGWYSKGNADLFLKYGASYLIHIVYKGWTDFLCKKHPLYKFNIFKFGMVPHGSWSNIEFRKKFIFHCESEENINGLSDWIKLPIRDILERNGGRGLVALYNNSPIDAFIDCYASAYPHININRNDFRMPNNYFNDISNQIYEIKNIEKKYQFKDAIDWYKCASKQFFIDNNLESLISNQYGGNYKNALISIYSQINPPVILDSVLFDSKSSSGEKIITLILQQLQISFEREWYCNINPCVYNAKCFFDFKLNHNPILIEYHGEQHYKNINWSGSLTKDEMDNNLEQVKLRDEYKRTWAKDNGYLLIEIPYWYDTEDKIKEIIEKQI
jgi:hypothetical protein